MHDARRFIASQMAALIQGHYGCLDAAAEAINARFGSALHKGTLSRRYSGASGWPIDHVWALEDAAGQFPLTNVRARQIAAAPAPRGAARPVLAASAAKEAGEAIGAIVLAETSASAGDHLAAVREIDEAITALQSYRARLERDLA